MNNIINFDYFYSDNEPKIGMGCTICYITDSLPATIVDIRKRNGKITSIQVQLDDYILINGNEYDGSAEYEYKRNSNKPKYWYSLRKNNRYVIKGTSQNGTPILSIGHRRRYYDPHF